MLNKVHKMKLVRNAGQSQRFRFAVLVLGCFLVSMTFIVISRPGLSAAAPPDYQNSVEDVPASLDIEISGKSSDSSVSSGEKDTQITSQPIENNNEQGSIQEEKNEVVVKQTQEEEKKRKNIDDHSGNNSEPENKSEIKSKTEAEKVSSTNDESGRLDNQPGRITLPTASNYTINDSEQVEKPSVEQPDTRGPPIVNIERKPLCDTSNLRVDVCDMKGDIRIPGNTTSVLYIEQARSSKVNSNESYMIHPYPRKGDKSCFSRVTEVAVKTSNAPAQCTKNYKILVVIFSSGGYAGNLFHDFTDLLIPLYLTAGEFNGEVLLMATDFSPYWIYKYIKFFQKLSHYPVIDFQNNKDVHCFDRAIVGLRAHNELTIDPSRSPKGVTMVDFTRFVRSAYSLPREAITNIENMSAKRPRLMLIARKRTRTFTNVHEIIQLAEDMGFEVIVHDAEAGIHIAEFAELVNSCDVLMGVHGAGLTNAMFLPPNGTLIQIVPWGSLEGISMLDFGNPAKDMKMNYLQYSISVEESSLLDKYPRNHPVFTDPLKYHNINFHTLRSTFLAQNVKLDVKRFRSVLWKALEHIIQ